MGKMVFLKLPNVDQILEIQGNLSTAPFSYSEVGATRGELPATYNVDRYSVVLGHGDRVFESAKQSIRDWVPFHLPWIRVFPQSELREDVLVAVVVRLVGVWWVNVSRVIYTVDESHSFGFAYGTLPFHAEQGEELFLVERSPETGEVTYRILAFSRPRHLLARLGYPFARAAQRGFGAGSKEAMLQATLQPK